MGSDRRRRPAGHESRVFAARAAGGTAGGGWSRCWLLWTGAHPLRVRVTFSLLAVGAWLVGAALRARARGPAAADDRQPARRAARGRLLDPRARRRAPDDALGLALLEVNTLSDTLRAQRLGALEATALLRRVMEEIDVAVFAFDGGQRLRLVNRGGERLLGQPAERLLGLGADALGLARVPRGRDAAHARGGVPRRRRAVGGAPQLFRQDGLPHQLLVLSDLSRALRAEERSAWQRLVRVLGHEINNSLAPIKSIAGSLRSLAERPARAADWEQDLRAGCR